MKLQTEGKKRDLAPINLAIDSKQYGCDVVAVRVDDVASSPYVSTVRYLGIEVDDAIEFAEKFDY